MVELDCRNLARLSVCIDGKYITELERSLNTVLNVECHNPFYFLKHSMTNKETYHRNITYYYLLRYDS